MSKFKSIACQCLESGDPRRCVSKNYGVQSAVSYFCGQLRVCDDSVALPTSQRALSIAKANIEKYYIHVGVLEYIISSLELLEYTLPLLFTGLVNTYRQLGKAGRVNAVPSEYRVQISDKSRLILRELLHAEYDLYEFVKLRFIQRYTSVFHRPPVKHKNYIA